MTSYRGGVLTGGGLRTNGRSSTVLVGVAVLLAAAVGGLRFGGLGLLLGAVLVGAWLVVPPIVVFALGQVFFAALLPADAPLSTLAVVEAPLVLLVVGDVLDVRAPVRTLSVGVVSLTALGCLVVVGVVLLDALWQVGALLVCTAAVLGYGLHRYTVVTLEATHGI